MSTAIKDPYIRVNLTLPQSFVDAIDDARGEEKRSEWIRDLVKRKLREYRLKEPPETRGRPRVNP